MSRSCKANPASGDKAKPPTFKVQLSGVLKLVTLISVYYSGCSLLVSCSFLTDRSSSAVAAVTVASASERQQLEANNALPEINDHDEHHPPQANDIFTLLTHPQGQTNDYPVNHDDKDKSAARGSGTTAADSGLANNLQPMVLSASVDGPLNKKRNAFLFPVLKKSHAQGVNEEARSTQQRSSDMSCRDEGGNRISWFIAYKLPHNATNQDPLIRQGSKYYFLTGNQKSSWIESSYPIHSNQSVLGTTMQILWISGNASNIAKLAYNDQPPSQPAVVMNGHTKGLIWSSTESGVWLQHSCPHFPDLAATNFTSSYPEGGLINGQMFMCMSLENASSVDLIGRALQYTRPHIYNYSIPAVMESLLPELSKVAEKNATVRKAPWFTSFQLAAGELQLQIHAKGPKFRREIYSDWIAPEYGTSLDVQSWLNGAHPFMSNCTTPKLSVWNVIMKNVSVHSFTNVDDHSKWAVSTEKDKPVTCITDLNRMKPQKTRGGVAICMTDTGIWSAFKSMVDAVQLCNSTSLKQLQLQI